MSFATAAANAMNWPARRPVAALLLAAILAIASVLLVMRLRADASLQALTSSNDPAAMALDRVLNRFSAAQELLVFAWLPDGAPSDTAPLLNFAQRLQDAVAHDPTASAQVAAVSYRPDALSIQLVEKVIAPNGLFYLNDEEYAAARQRLTRDGMAEQFRRDEQMLSAPGPSGQAFSESVKLDPLRLYEFLLGRMASLKPLQGGAAGDAFYSTDGRGLLIRIAGVKPPGNTDFSKDLTASISRLAAQCNEDGKLQLDISGAYAIAAHSASAIRADSIDSVRFSLISLALLFICAFHRPLRQFTLALLPVALGVLYGFAVYSIFQQTITPLTAVIGGVLAGIGIDYSIQYLSHYDSRRRHATPLESATHTIRTIGGPLVAAWATSVIGFFAIAASSVRILRDFALAGTLGLAGAFFCTLLVLPAVLVLTDRAPAGARSSSRFTAEPFVRWLGDRRRSALSIGFCCLLVALPLAGLLFGDRTVLSLESDMTILHPRPNPPLDAEKQISQRMGISPDSLIVHLTADSGQQLVERAHDVQNSLSREAAKEAGVTASFGLATVLPDPRVAQARTSETGPAYADRVLADFDAALADSPFSPDAFAPYKTFLRTLLTANNSPGVDALKNYPQIRNLILPHQRAAGDPYEAITLVFLRNSLDQRADRDRVLEILRTELHDLPGVTLTGLAVIGHDIEATVRHDLPRLVVLAIVAVAAYLFAHFRSITVALLALAPTIFSLICVLGIFELTGQRLNLVNIVAIPLLIGIDVDYGIFMIGTALGARENDEQRTSLISTSAQAILLCAVSATLGFGSIYFTSIPAVQSLGLATGTGVIACALGSILLLSPILLRVRLK